jgi:hypothetical protein
MQEVIFFFVVSIVAYGVTQAITQALGRVHDELIQCRKVLEYIRDKSAPWVHDELHSNRKVLEGIRDRIFAESSRS